MRVLCVTCVRDEGPFLLDWLAHHRGLGVTDFLIYSNDCSDGTVQMLDALQASGFVNHIPQDVPPNKTPQWQGLKDAWKHPARKAADWVLATDVDEYLNIKTGNGTLTALMDAVPDCDAVALPWRLFGNSDVVGFEDRPVAEQFTKSAPENGIGVLATHYFKTLFRAKGPFNKIGVHRPKRKPDAAARWVDAGGTPLPDEFAQRDSRPSLAGYSTVRDLVELNHYSVRSVESFIVKTARGLPSSRKKAIDLAYWVERNFNQVENTTIARHSDATATEKAFLLAIPGMAELHDASVQWHRRRLPELLRDPAVMQLYGQIMIAGGSTGMPPVMAAEFDAAFARMKQDL